MRVSLIFVCLSDCDSSSSSSEDAEPDEPDEDDDDDDDDGDGPSGSAGPAQKKRKNIVTIDKQKYLNMVAKCKKFDDLRDLLGEGADGGQEHFEGEGQGSRKVRIF